MNFLNHHSLRKLVEATGLVLALYSLSVDFNTCPQGTISDANVLFIFRSMVNYEVFQGKNHVCEHGKQKICSAMGERATALISH